MNTQIISPAKAISIGIGRWREIEGYLNLPQTLSVQREFWEVVIAGEKGWLMRNERSSYYK